MDWGRVAEELCGGRCSAPTRRVCRELSGYPCEIRFTPDADAADFVLEVRVASHTFDRLILRSAALLRLVPDSHRFPRPKTGDAAFDRAFRVETQSRRQLDRWLEAGAREAITALQSALGRHSIWITLCGDRARIACLCRIAEPRRMQHLLDAAQVVAETALRALRIRNEVAVPQSAADAGTCCVCGGTLSSAVVHCAGCRTPCHRDCWRFMGLCPIFACGSQRFEEMSHEAPDPVPPARTPEAIAADSVRAVLRWMNDAVRELQRADATYADIGWKIGETEDYLRIKRVGFSVLADELSRAAPEGIPGLLHVLGTFAFHPVLAEDFGLSAFETADAKRACVVDALTRFLENGAPLPDPARTI